MDKNEAIKLIQGIEEDGRNVTSEHIEALSYAVSHLEEDRWIPVSERLPEEGKSVLVCIKTQGGMSQYVSERFNGNNWSALGGRTPIAWRPLPKPYQEPNKLTEETITAIWGALIEHGQHDHQFHLGDTIKYTPDEVADILRQKFIGGEA